MIQIISRQLRDDSDYAYIRHYLIRYQNVPLWLIMNVLTIGQLSKMYYCQKGRIKIKVCQEFGPLKINEMGKMLSIMTKFRKVCFKKYKVHKMILGKMGFPENWERINRIKKYTKSKMI